MRVMDTVKSERLTLGMSAIVSFTVSITLINTQLIHQDPVLPSPISLIQD